MEILWFILSLIPFVNVIAAIMCSLKVSEKFGKGSGFAVGLFLLPFIFYPILGFGSAEYEDRPKRRKLKKTRPRDEEEEDLEDEG